MSSVEKRALFNSYDLSIELGKGSFATVYKALHRASGEWVAVKVIHEACLFVSLPHHIFLPDD